jgi:NAD(P)-dependent dehydrogenase (short-subunit alcohol dehydrogenase family)
MADASSFASRGVVVTGANRGIGQAVALAFLKEGWRVVVVARTLASLEGLRELAGPSEKALERLACAGFATPRPTARASMPWWAFPARWRWSGRTAASR